MKKGVKKFRRKIFLLFIVFTILSVALFCSFRSSYNQFNEKIKEKEELVLQYQELVDEQDALEKEVARLQDPEYIARYVREKYINNANFVSVLSEYDKLIDVASLNSFADLQKIVLSNYKEMILNGEDSN